MVIKISAVAKEFKSTKLCTKCKGHCCKHLPGITFPADFGKPLLRSLVEHFKTGLWAIDWWEADSPGYYVRPATKGVSQLFDPSWGGECIFLTDSGCSLPFEKRPIGCRRLKPARADTAIKVAFGLCKYYGEGPDSKWDAAQAWKPYRRILLKAAEIYEQTRKEEPWNS